MPVGKLFVDCMYYFFAQSRACVAICLALFALSRSLSSSYHVRCSAYQLVLPETEGQPSRVCKICFQEITGQSHREENLAKQTAQLSLFVAKNMKNIPLSAYESFMNVVNEQVALSEQR